MSVRVHNDRQHQLPHHKQHRHHHQPVQDSDEEHKADEQVTNSQLWDAARRGHVELLERVPLQRLLESRHSNGWKGGRGLFREAIKHGQGGVVQYLVRRSVESGEDFVEGWTPGHAAAYAGDLAALDELTEEQLHATNTFGESLLHAAAWGGHVAAIERLVELGADPNATNEDGETSLHEAVRGGHVAAIERLVGLGADPTPARDTLAALLRRKAAKGDVAAIDRLVQAGADVNVTSSTGASLLHLAARGGYVAAIELLVKLGADPEAINHQGETCLHKAAEGGHVVVIERLVELGADTLATAKNGGTCLHSAAEGGHVAAIERLVELGAHVSARDCYGYTPLHSAAWPNRAAAAALLVYLGAESAARTESGSTALTLASERGHSDIASFLTTTHGWLVAADSGQATLQLTSELPTGLVSAPLSLLVAFGEVTEGRLGSVLRLPSAEVQSLEVLSIRGLDSRGVCLLAPALTSCLKLRRLDLSSEECSGEGLGDDALPVLLQQLEAMPHLHYVSLRRNHISETGVAAVLRALLPRVQHVDLRDNDVAHERVTAVVDALAVHGLQHAVEASWTFVGSGDEVILHEVDAAILRCASVCDVRLQGRLGRLHFSTATSAEAFDAAVEFLHLVESDVELSLQHTHLAEDQQSALTKATDIKVLDVSDTRDADWTALLAGSSCLVEVTMSGCSLSCEEAVALASLPSLVTLDLSSSTFDNLDWLRSCFSLTSLSLASCNISSADLDAIVALPRLERLVLAGATVDCFDSLASGCPELRFLDVSGCGISHAPVFLASRPALEQVAVADNPFMAGLQEYAELLADPVTALEFLRTLALSSGGKTRDVPVVLVGHGRAGKSQVLHSLQHARSWKRRVPGVVERVSLVTERTSNVESGVHTLQMSAQRRSSGKMVTDEFEARFFDTPGQMEFFASNMAVLSPLFSSCVVLCVVRCVLHGVSLSNVLLAKEKKRIASEFRLWLAEVSRAVLGAHRADDDQPLGVPPNKRASVAMVLTHRDVLQQARGKEAVSDVESWLGDLAEELRVEFEDSLEVHGSASFVNATVAGVRGHGVAPVRAQLENLVHSRFVLSPTLPDVLVDARAFVVSEEVRQHRIFGRPALEKLLSSKFAERGLTLRLVRCLLGVLETNGSVLCSPAGRLVVVDPGWISGVMSSLYADPRWHDLEHVDASEFDALAAFDKDGEVLASELLTHLRQFVDGDDALLERLLLVLVSNGIAIPLRVFKSATGACKTKSYLIVGRWMTDESGTSTIGAGWTTARSSEASWFELVTGKAWSSEQAARMLMRLDEEPAFRLVSLRCKSGVRMGPSFLTWLMYELSKKLTAGKHSFTVRRSGFACVLPFTRFHAAVHVQLPASGREFDLTVLAKAGDAEAALSFVLLEMVLPVLDKLSPGGSVQRLDVVQRCGGCVGTDERLKSDLLHDRELAGGARVVGTSESVYALCKEVCDGANYRAEMCRGCEGVLSSIGPEEVDDRVSAVPLDFASSFVPVIGCGAIELDQKPRLLGSGQFGSVMEGSFNGARVVLKELKVSSNEALAAFEREAELLGRASRHPCISLLLGICRMGEAQVYLVMERAGVCDLEKALCESVKKPLLGAAWGEFGVLLGLLKDVADGLRHMHSQDPPIVHNDVALRNILVRHENGQNRAKLTDMGLARAVPRGEVKRLAPGTPVPKWQLAPETLRSRLVSPASDVFQFGMLVYEMMARERPFWRRWVTPGGKEERKRAHAAVVNGIKNGTRPLHEGVGAVGAHCDDWLWQLAEECWRDDPLMRPTMAQVSARLAKVIRKRGGVPSEQAPLRWRAVDSQKPHGFGCARGSPCMDVNEDRDCDQPPPAAGPIQSAPACTHSAPSIVSNWAVDDVCAWLLQSGIPACVELVPLFRHQGVDGTILLDLEMDDLTELGVSRMTAKVLLRACDELRSSPE